MNADEITGLVVPRRGQSVWLITLSAGAMAFLAVFSLALALGATQLAQSWGAALSQTATIRLSAPPDEMDTQTELVLEVLRTTPGIEAAQVMVPDEQAALLEAWLGPDLPLDALPLPRLIEVTETPEGPDRQGLRLRLAAEAPGAVYDDHTRWRRPLAEAAGRLRALALVSLGLIGGVTGAIIALAASVALASNRQVIGVLRLVGAQDRFIARAFVRRISLRAGLGALAGTALGMAAMAALPQAGGDVHLLAGLGFRGAGWALPLLIPPLAILLAWGAARATAFRVLRRVT